MADRYWRGGTGTWNGVNTTNWSTTSGGAGGASVPTSSDNVFFNASSGGGTCTATGDRDCANFTTTGYTGTFSANSSIQSYGNVLLGTGGTVSNLEIVSRASSGTVSYDLQGRTIRIVRILAFPGVTFNAASNLNSSGEFVVASLGGTINSNNFAFNGGSVLYLSNSGAGNINLGTSQVTNIFQITCTGSGNITSTGAVIGTNSTITILLSSTGNVSISNFPNAFFTNFTFTRTSTGTFTGLANPVRAQNFSLGASTTFSTGAELQLTASVNIPSSSSLSSLNCYQATTVNILDSGTIDTLTSSSFTTQITFSAAATTTVTSFNVTGPPGTTTIRSSSSGNVATISSSSYSLSNISWKDITAAGNIPFTGTGFVNLGNNTNITFPLPSGNGLFFGSNF